MNFTTIFDHLRAICEMAGYEWRKRVDRIHIVEPETNRLDQPSRSCCVDESLEVSNSAGDSGGDKHVRRIGIIHIVRLNTHL